MFYGSLCSRAGTAAHCISIRSGVSGRAKFSRSTRLKTEEPDKLPSKTVGNHKSESSKSQQFGSQEANRLHRNSVERQKSTLQVRFEENFSRPKEKMPLKAKVQDPAFANRAVFISGREPEQPKPNSERPSEIIKELPGDEKEDVLFDTIFGLRTIELNRPAKLHSLNASMIRKIVPRLQIWAQSDMANVVIIKGSGPKAFCAGGDVAALAQANSSGTKGQKESTDYFALEYTLDHLIATYTKPYIAIMDGITMGGGVGLSVHAPIRIATERTLFAMPETTIGFFPDVGASFFLPRMNGAIGTYLALTSERLEGVNAFYTGVATHYVHSTSIYALERRLAELRFKDYNTLTERLDLINSTIEEFSTGLPHDQPMVIAGEIRRAIDRCFRGENVPDIIAALKREKGQSREWAEKTLATLKRRSPLSVWVTLRQMQLGRKWSIAETFRREHQMAHKFMCNSDFTEGVHALLIRKDGQPKWRPASLEDIEPDSRITETYFELDGEVEQLRLLNNTDYSEYPHTKYSLPTEADVEKFVSHGKYSSKATLEYFLKLKGGKQGVKEVVQEILDRRTNQAKEDDALLWVEKEKYLSAT